MSAVAGISVGEPVAVSDDGPPKTACTLRSRKDDRSRTRPGNGLFHAPTGSFGRCIRPGRSAGHLIQDARQTPAPARVFNCHIEGAPAAYSLTDSSVWRPLFDSSSAIPSRSLCEADGRTHLLLQDGCRRACFQVDSTSLICRHCPGFGSGDFGRCKRCLGGHTEDKHLRGHPVLRCGIAEWHETLYGAENRSSIDIDRGSGRPARVGCRPPRG